jgi:hypothetical protein
MALCCFPTYHILHLALCDFNPFAWMKDQMNCLHFNNEAGICVPVQKVLHHGVQEV